MERNIRVTTFIHQTTENNTTSAGHKVCTGKSTAVDCNCTDKFVHFCFFTDQKCDRCHKRHDSKETCTQCCDSGSGKVKSKWKKSRKITTYIKKIAGSFFQSSVYKCEIVKQRYGKNNEHRVYRPAGDHLFGLHSHGKTSNKVCKNNSKKARVKSGLISDNDSYDNRCNN